MSASTATACKCFRASVACVLSFLRWRRKRIITRLSARPPEFATDPSLRWIIALLPRVGCASIRVSLHENGEGTIQIDRDSDGRTHPLSEAAAGELFAILQCHFPHGFTEYNPQAIARASGNLLAVHQRAPSHGVVVMDVPLEG